MKKKIARYTIIILLILGIAFGGLFAWIYYHPELHLTTAVSGKVEFPAIAYGVSFLGMPDKVYREWDDFTDGIYMTVKAKEEEYPKDLELTYDITRLDGGGSIITFHGTGIKKDGTKETFSEELKFDINLTKL